MRNVDDSEDLVSQSQDSSTAYPKHYDATVNKLRLAVDVRTQRKMAVENLGRPTDATPERDSKGKLVSKGFNFYTDERRAKQRIKETLNGNVIAAAAREKFQL